MIQHALFLVSAVLASVSPLASNEDTKRFKLDYLNLTSLQGGLMNVPGEPRDAILEIIENDDSTEQISHTISGAMSKGNSIQGQPTPKRDS